MFRNRLRTFVVSLAMCSLFASTLVRADDCSDALIAESCACHSSIRSERDRLRGSTKAPRPEGQQRVRQNGRAVVAKQGTRLTQE